MAKNKTKGKKAVNKQPKSSALRADTGAKQTKPVPISFNKGKPGKIAAQAVVVQKETKTGKLKIRPAIKSFSQTISFGQIKKKTKLSKNPVKILNKEAFSLQREGRLEAAIACMERAIRISPTDPKLYLDLGNILAIIGDSKKAEALIQKSILLNPDEAMAHNSLGILLRAKKQKSQAQKELELANKLKPNQFDILLNLGTFFNEINKFEEAIPYLLKARKLDEKNPNALTQLAKALHETDCPGESVMLVEWALKEDPNLIPAIELAYDISKKLKIKKTQLQCLRKLVKLKPENRSYALRLADNLRHSQRSDQALTVLKNHFKNVKKMSAMNYHILGEYSFYTHKLDQAIDYFKKCLSLDPKVAEAYNFYGRCLSSKGDRKGAREMFLKSIDARPNYLNPYFFIAEVDKIEPNDPAFKRLEEIKKKDHSMGEKAAVGFALGRLYEKIKNYKKAFENFKYGNKNANTHYHSLGFEYKPKEVEQNYRFKKVLFSEENRKKITFKGSNFSQPLFILGLPRTGTTLLEQILSSHSQIETAGELPEMTRIWNTLNEKIGKKGPEKEILKKYISFINKNGNAMAESYLKILTGKGGDGALVVDKMPQNSLQLGLLSILFPKAKIIHMRRNPLDSGLSMYCNQLGGGWSFTRDLEHLGHQYQLNEDLMQFWKDTLEIPIYDVWYEELTENPEKIVRGALKFCGKRWQKKCLEFYKKDTEVFTSSVVQVRRPINKKSLEKWKCYEKELQPLKKALGPLMK